MKILSLVKKRIFPILFIGIVLSGCGVWTDFTTYFNLYYNTTVAFEKAEAEIEKEQKDIFEFKETKLVGTADQNLTKVIEKCSKILQFNSESSYVDDALFMIGKAFYYQQSYTQAIRKFLELLTVEEKSLALEAELWLGKSRLQMREFDEGLAVLESVKEKALIDDEKAFYDAASVTEIAYFLYKEDYEKTIESCKALIDVTNDDELISKTYYKLGQVYVILKDYDNALYAFEQVNEYSPDFDLEFYSQLEYSKVKSIQKDFEGSMEMLDDLLNEDKFVDHQDLINIEIGKNHYALNEIEEAMDVFLYVDSTFSKSDNVGMADFYLGKIWEFSLGDYDSAKQYYKLASVSKIPDEYKDSAKTKMEIFDRYSFLRKEYNVNTDREFYLLNPEIFIEDSITYAEYEVRLNDFLEEKLLEQQENNDNPQALLGQHNTQEQPGQNPTQPTAGQRQNTTLGQPPANVQGNNAIAALKAKLKPSDYPPELIEVNKPEKTKLSIDSLNSIIAKNTLDLGNLFFADLEVADSAYYYYNKLLTDFKEHRIYPNALFAMGSLLSTENQKENADSLFRIIYNDYPQSTVYIEAAKKLNLWVEEDHYDPSKEIYLEAEEKYYNNQVDSAFAIWKGIIKDYPSSDYAPKALLSIGFILENDLMLPDSAYSIYSKLAELYGSSKYAGQVTGKIMAYKEQFKINDDSSAAVNSNNQIVPVDSVNVTNEKNIPGLNEIPKNIERQDSSLTQRRVMKKEIRGEDDFRTPPRETKNSSDSLEIPLKNNIIQPDSLPLGLPAKDSSSTKREIVPRDIRNNIRPGTIPEKTGNPPDSLEQKAKPILIDN